MNGSSYSPADIIPFSRETYRSLLTHYNEQIWPLQLVFLAASIAILLVCEFPRSRSFLASGMVLAGCWWWTALAFLKPYFAPLMPYAWIGTILAMAQGLACLMTALGTGEIRIRRDKTFLFRLGGLLLLASAWLPLPLFWGEPISAILLFGWGPTATAIGTFGVLLMTEGGRLRWLLLLIPGIWILFFLFLQAGLVAK